MRETSGTRPAQAHDPQPDGAARIFISVASYRDSELGPTLEDCLAKARHPERIRFGVCWQHGDDEPAPGVLADPRCSVIELDWRESHGGWWARAQTTQLWRGEEWFLQLDAHHRFAPDWDQVLLEQAAATGSERPLLTAILPGYIGPGGEERLAAAVPWQISVRKFVDGIPSFIPSLMPRLDRPMRARFLCGHFVFAPGVLLEEIAYDPELYMLGGEPVLGLRAYSHGFDLFHPNKTVIWHDHRHRAHHQRDHTRAAGCDRTRGDTLDARSRERARRFLCEPHIGRYGLGEARSAAAYEAYAGISFRESCVQDYTRRGEEPPNPPADADWALRTYERRARITLELESLPATAPQSPFWALSIRDADGVELTRQDVDAGEIAAALVAGGPTVTLERRFESTAPPARWVLWCPLPDGGWDWSHKLSGAVLELDQEAELAVCPRSVAHDTQEANGGFDVWPRGRSASVLHTNRSGMLILELCDGAHSLREIAAAVAEAFDLEALPLELVRDFTAEAAARGLLSS